MRKAAEVEMHMAATIETLAPPPFQDQYPDDIDLDADIWANVGERGDGHILREE